MKIFKTHDAAIEQIKQDMNLDCVKDEMIKDINSNGITKSLDTIYVVDELNLLN